MTYELRKIPGILAAVAASIIVPTYFLALAIGLIAITTSQIGPNLLSLNGHLPIEAFLQIFPTDVPINLLVLVVSCIIVYFACFWASARAKGGFVAGLRNLWSGSKPRSTPNWLVAMPLVSSSLFIVVLILTYALGAAGVSSGNLNETDITRLFADLTYSPIAEEVGFRLTTIGVLVALRIVWHYLTRPPKTPSARAVFAAIISPERGKELAGLPSVRNNGWRGIHWTEWILLVITSVIFGIDHVTSGAGWGPGKAFTAGLSGFVLGFVYLSYGAYADILLHWFFNFYLYVFTIDAGFAGIFVILGDVVVLATLFVGALGFIISIAWLMMKNGHTMDPPMTYISP